MRTFIVHVAQSYGIRAFGFVTGKQVKGFKLYWVDSPNLRNATTERVYFIQVPFFSLALFMGYKLAQ